jgi:hypothetical protein
MKKESTNFMNDIIIFNRCAAEIMDDFIPACRQDVDMFTGMRETNLSYTFLANILQ